MKKGIIILLFIVLENHIVMAQNKGVYFQEGNWNEILTLAREQNKGVFIDCYTTWCGPCKMMDSQVYSDSLVGNYMNSQYISIKLQMDSTTSDDILIESRYEMVKDFIKKYDIKAFPTLLFFSSNGEMVHRGVGFMNCLNFMHLAEEAQDPTKQYYRRIEEFKANKIEIKDLPDLANLAKKFGDDDLSIQIGTRYKINHLDHLTDKELLNSKKDIEFLLSNYNLISTKDRFFKYCYYHPKLVDSAKLGLINWFLAAIIDKEEVSSKLWNNKKAVTLSPDWNTLYSNIKNKYNKVFADLILPPEKLYFYQKVGNWNEYANLVDQAMLANPPVNVAFDLNNRAWLMFSECNDSDALLRALDWSNKVIEITGDSYPRVYDYYDTRANLLYKLGKKNEAILNEQKAIDLSKDNKHSNEYFLNIKSKMEQGIPTWKKE
ncbi:thioredoxin family protein [Chitinophaga sp.]|uniref:thioredoxin family protein n=1 Tax=Chitinophaga sp. TaxID=1869181 RepID=UPI0031E36863